MHIFGAKATIIVEEPSGARVSMEFDQDLIITLKRDIREIGECGGFREIYPSGHVTVSISGYNPVTTAMEGGSPSQPAISST